MITNAKILGCEKNEELNGPLTIENQMAPYSICKALKTPSTTCHNHPTIPNNSQLSSWNH